MVTCLQTIDHTLTASPVGRAALFYDKFADSTYRGDRERSLATGLWTTYSRPLTPHPRLIPSFNGVASSPRATVSPADEYIGDHTALLE